jgi:hypothetical protein
MTTRSDKTSAQQKRLHDLLLEVSRHAHKDELLRYIAARGAASGSKLVALITLIAWGTLCSV